MSRSLDRSYWGETGRYQLVYNGLHKLIPASGSVKDNDELELLRVVSNLYYDLYNNGLCNAEIRLPDVKEMMDIFRELLIQKMGSEQFGLVYECWVQYKSTSCGHWDNNKWDFVDDTDSSGYFPEWDSSTGWFSERLMLAFEKLLDAAVEICVAAQEREFAEL